MGYDEAYWLWIWFQPGAPRTRKKSSILIETLGPNSMYEYIQPAHETQENVSGPGNQVVGLNRSV